MFGIGMLARTRGSNMEKFPKMDLVAKRKVKVQRGMKWGRLNK